MSDSQDTTFTAMRDATREDYQKIGRLSLEFAAGLPSRVLTHLQLLQGDTGGYAVDRLTHSLQSATRAQRDGRDDEYVVCALIHDIGDTLATANHSDLAATILEPFVSDQNYWIVKHHGIFQGYYFFHHLGLDQNMRDRFRDHEWWSDCAQFCELYDQNCFDAEYDTLPLEAFEPLVRKVFSTPRKSIYVPDSN
ncbi:MAG TPA: phosphohydrolase [Myxococcales bacterium]|jgi:predicted HD phosphohydrolase|nr:phosphohydrolase [Myxococcales bacterium]HIL99860.1 phosphohydrolase [Myxococcales bacterium]